MSGKASWVQEGYSPSLEPPANTAKQLVYGPLSWVTENPGAQLLTGSFHPVSDEMWYDQAYTCANTLGDFAQTLTASSFVGSSQMVIALLRRNRNASVDTSCPFTSRRALQLACASGNEDCVAALLDAGATMDEVDPSTGFKAVHFAALGGFFKILDLLSRRGAELDTTTTKQRWNPLHFASYYGHRDIAKVIPPSFPSTWIS